MCAQRTEQRRTVAQAVATLIRTTLVAGSLVSVAGCGPSSPSPGPSPQPAALAAVALTAGAVQGGNPVAGNVTLTANAPAAGAVVALSSSNAAAATVPASVTIPSGAASIGYTVSTSPVDSAAVVTVTGSYLGVTQTAALTVNPVAVTVRADFAFTPSAGTTPPAGQCTVTRTTSGTVLNVLRCRFDAGSSTPSPGITEYRWQFPGASAAVTGVTVTDPLVSCGTFGGVTARDVTLTITAPQGTNATTKSVTFQKVNEC